MFKLFREKHGKLRDMPAHRRVRRLKQVGEISAEDARFIEDTDPEGCLREMCDELGVENVIAAFPMPLGVAEHFVVNGRAIPGVPMVTEERTVVAAASKAAKLVSHDGFVVETGAPVARAQVLLEIPSVESYVKGLPSSEESVNALNEMREEVEIDGAPFRKYGGGHFKLVERSFLQWDERSFAELTLSVTTGEAMGARGVTAYAKALGEYFSRKHDWKPVSWICLNDNPGRWVEATAEWPAMAIDGEKVVRRILDNQAWAEKSGLRTITHNKGVMNGIDAVALATGQDTRAIEAGAWSYASNLIPGPRKFRPLTSYVETEKGIRGKLRMQLTVGTVGGATQHPFAQFSRRLMGVKTSKSLMEVMGAVGLAQNFAALAWALQT